MASVPSSTVRGVSFALLVFTLTSLPCLAKSRSGLVEDPNATNTSLLVGVSHGLPGIDIDVDNVKTMGSNSAYNLKPSILQEASASAVSVAQKLTETSEAAGPQGTFMFYFSGHGSIGYLYMHDVLMAFEKIKDAIIAGRKSQGPLARLVLMYDSCHSGSLVDPLMSFTPMSQFQTDDIQSVLFADKILEVMSGGSNRSRASDYWKKLFVFASSRSDETSMASPNGSIFTLALYKAFNEVVGNHGTVGDLVSKTKEYTIGHHPVERLVPDSLRKESLRP